MRMSRDRAFRLRVETCEGAISCGSEQGNEQMSDIGRKHVIAAILTATALTGPGTAVAQQLSPQQFVTTVNITVVPIATLTFDTTPLLYVEVPPPGSTIPSAGVAFTVSGNASASIAAEPDGFIQVPGSLIFPPVSGNVFLGKATRPEGDEIGYNLQLTFPALGGSGVRLPLLSAGAAVSPVIDVVANGGSVSGVLDLIANQNWTASGGFALPGLYEGEIILTLSPS
jgi:hypothetical protein